LLAKGMVGALGVVKDQPVGQFAVKERKVGKEQLLVVVDEGLLDCSVESFGVGVHLRVFGVGVPALDALIFKEAGEVGLELTAVETLGSAMPCLAHQGPRSTWRLLLPRLG
jgi:hypothetical protein